MLFKRTRSCNIRDDAARIKDQNNVLYNVKFKNIVGINILLGNLFGTIIPTSNSIMKRLFFYARSGLFIGFFFIGIFISELVNLLKHLDSSLIEIASSSFVFLTHLVQLLKYYCFLKYNYRIMQLMDSINREEFLPRSIQQLQVLNNAIQYSKVILTIFMSVGMLTCSFWCLYPFLEEEEYKLPLAGWFPFSTDVSPQYEIAFAFQVIAVTINGVSNINIDTLMSASIMVVCTQLHLLNDSLQNIKLHPLLDLDVNVFDVEKISPELQDAMNKQLLQCIRHHRCILEYADELTFLFSNSILGQFVVSVVIICITLFEMTVVPFPSLNFFSIILYQCCMLLEIFLLCYFGNEVVLESTQLTNFAYHSDWYCCSKEFKRNLLYFMIRSQKVLKLYAGGFFTLSLDTFVNILKSSWSYFAVLLQVNKKTV